MYLNVILLCITRVNCLSKITWVALFKEDSVLRRFLSSMNPRGRPGACRAGNNRAEPLRVCPLHQELARLHRVYRVKLRQNSKLCQEITGRLLEKFLSSIFRPAETGLIHNQIIQVLRIYNTISSRPTNHNKPRGILLKASPKEICHSSNKHLHRYLLADISIRV